MKYGTDEVYPNLSRMGLYGLINIQLAANDPQAAYDLAGAEQYYGRQRQPFTDIEIAKSFAKKGENPKPPLDRAYAHAGAVVIGSERGTRIKHERETKAEDLLLLSSAHFAVGSKEFPHLLAEAEELIGLPPLANYPSLQKELAVGYAKINAAIPALRIADAIPVDTSQHADYRQRALRAIANQFVSDGNIRDAVTAARKTQDSLFIATIAANAVIAHGAKGRVDATRLLNLAKTHIEPEEVHRKGESTTRKIDHATTLALVAQASHQQGKDADALFAQALKITKDIDTDDIGAAEVYTKIAKHQEFTGIDASPLWKRAVSLLETHVEQNRDWTDRAIAGEVMKDIATALVETKNYDEAIEVAGRYKTLENDPVATTFQARIYADIASALIQV